MSAQQPSLQPNPEYQNWVVSIKGRPDADKHQEALDCPCHPRLFAINDQYRQNLYTHREVSE